MARNREKLFAEDEGKLCITIVFFSSWSCSGEATFAKFYGATHGALASGWREADRIVASFK